MDIIYETVRGFTGQRWIIHALVSGLEMHHVEIAFNKNEICPFVQGLVTMYERQHNIVIKIIQIDGETSLTDKFNEWIRKEGINISTSAPDSWEQNGPIERAGGRLGEVQRTLRISSLLPENLFPELWKTSAYLLNRTPTSSLGGKSPWQVLNEHQGKTGDAAKPQIGHIRAIGSRVYVMDKHVPKGRKSLPRAHIGYLTGFDATNIYRVWVPHLKRVFRARDVRIDETLGFDPANPHLDPLMITEVDDLVRIIEIPELPDAAQANPDYVHDDWNWNVLTQHHGASSSESPEEGLEAVPTPTSSNLRGYEKDNSHDQLPTPEPTPEPSFPIQLLPPKSQADPKLLPPANPVDDLADQFQQLQYDVSDRLVDTSFSPYSSELERPPARPSGRSEPQDSTTQKPKHSISADLLPDHIIEGKRTRKPRALHTAVSTLRTQEDPYSVFHATLRTLNMRTNRPRHQSEMPPVPRNYGALTNHPERNEFLKACDVEIHNLDKRDTFKIVDKPTNTFIVPLIGTR